MSERDVMLLGKIGITLSVVVGVAALGLHGAGFTRAAGVLLVLDALLWFGIVLVFLWSL